MQVKYLPDAAIAESGQDRLGFAAVAKEMVTEIASSEPPFTWGIFGDWGSGKTSLMRLIQQNMEVQLENPGNKSLPLLIPVWFDAWRYENEVNIIYPLFHAIRRDFEKRCKDNAAQKSFFGSFKKVATASVLGLTDLALRAATHHAFGQAVKLQDLEESLKRAETSLNTIFDTWVDEVGQLKEGFEEFVSTYIELYRKHNNLDQRLIRLAIFIDDLDRCLPEVAIDVLERIKNHLSTENCIFILGVNRKVVYQSIRKKYQDLEIDGRQHLEKIIQYSRGVPEATGDDLKQFALSNIIDRCVGKPTDEIRRHFETFAETLYACRFLNPRKIKRILNRFMTFIQLHSGADLNSYNLGAVTRLIIMREYQQDLFEIFSEAGFEALKDIHSFNGAKESEEEFCNRYGTKWKSLIVNFDKYKGLADLGDTNRKPKREYERSVLELFGRED